MIDRRYRQEADCYWAVARNLRVSASKVRPVARLLQKKSYSTALAILQALPGKGAKLLLPLLKSAAANALFKNRTLSEESLLVENIRINDAAMHKRIWRRGRGRADQQLMRYAHAGVVLRKGGN